MPIYQAQMTIMPATDIIADASVNTWCCIADSDADAESFVSALVTFYSSIVTGYSSLVAQSSHLAKIYRAADPRPRVPTFESNWGFSVAPTGNPLPTEVALTLSFQAVAASGINQASRRGRVYIGPLDVGTSSVEARPTTSVQTTLGNAALALYQASAAALNWTWAIYSPTRNEAAPVAGGWVDDEFDTQRRRGRESTQRLTWLAVPSLLT